MIGRQASTGQPIGIAIRDERITGNSRAISGREVLRHSGMVRWMAARLLDARDPNRYLPPDYRSAANRLSHGRADAKGPQRCRLRQRHGRHDRAGPAGPPALAAHALRGWIRRCWRSGTVGETGRARFGPLRGRRSVAAAGAIRIPDHALAASDPGVRDHVGWRLRREEARALCAQASFIASGRRTTMNTSALTPRRQLLVRHAGPPGPVDPPTPAPTPRRSPARTSRRCLRPVGGRPARLISRPFGELRRAREAFFRDLQGSPSTFPPRPDFRPPLAVWSRRLHLHVEALTGRALESWSITPMLDLRTPEKD